MGCFGDLNMFGVFWDLLFKIVELDICVFWIVVKDVSVAMLVYLTGVGALRELANT